MQRDKELEKFPWLTPAAIEILGGKFDPEKLTFPQNLVPALKKMLASDIRDWNVIREWANGLTVLDGEVQHSSKKPSFTT